MLIKLLSDSLCLEKRDMDYKGLKELLEGILSLAKTDKFNT